MNYSVLQKYFLSTKYKFELVYRDKSYTIVAIIYIIHGFLQLLVFETVNDLCWCLPAPHTCGGPDYFGVVPDQLSRGSTIYLPEA